MEQLGLKFVVHIDSESLYTKLDNIKAFMLIFIGVMLLISILLVFYISQKIFDPISDILSILEGSSGMGEEDILKNKNEVSYIRDSIYATISRNKDIEEELSVFETQVLELHITGMGYVEIAKVLGRDEKATDNALQRIRTKLKRYMHK